MQVVLSLLQPFRSEFVLLSICHAVGLVLKFIDKVVEWEQFSYQAVLGPVLWAGVKLVTHQKMIDSPRYWDAYMMLYEHHFAFLLTDGWALGRGL